MPGQAVLEIDPGMSFGTGQHATTFLSPKMIDELAGKPEVKACSTPGAAPEFWQSRPLLKYRPIDALTTTRMR